LDFPRFESSSTEGPNRVGFLLYSIPDDGNKTKCQNVQIHTIDEVQNNSLREIISLYFNSEGKLQK
jgi:hypothetical protein